MPLSEHPFFVLDGSPQYNQWKLSSLASKKSIFEERGKPEKALALLLDPVARLSAKIRWFPGCTPETAKALIQFAIAGKERLPAGDASLPPLAVFNALMYALPLRKPAGVDILAQSFNDLGKYQSLLRAKDILNLINHDRKTAKFLPPADQAAVDEALRALTDEAKTMTLDMVQRLGDMEQTALVPLLGEQSIVLPIDIANIRLRKFVANTGPRSPEALKRHQGAIKQLEKAKEDAAAAVPPPARGHATPAVSQQPEALENTGDAVLYAVPASTPATIPKFCACCMAPVLHTPGMLDSLRNVLSSLYPSGLQGFTLCPACQNHRKSSFSSITALCILPIAGVFLLAFLLGGITDTAYTRIILFLVLARVAHLYQLQKIIQPPFENAHAIDWDPVHMLHAGTPGEQAVYGFTNKKYATLFAQNNGSQVTERPVQRNMKAGELMKTAHAFRMRFRMLRGIALTVAILYLLIL